MREEYKCEFLCRLFKLHLRVTSWNERHHWWECLSHVHIVEKVPELRRTLLEFFYYECDPWTSNIGISWELIRNAVSFEQDPSWFIDMLKFKKHWDMLKFKKHWCHITQWCPFVQLSYLLCSLLLFPRTSSAHGQLCSSLKTL